MVKSCEFSMGFLERNLLQRNRYFDTHPSTGSRALEPDSEDFLGLRASESLLRPVHAGLRAILQLGEPRMTPVPTGSGLLPSSKRLHNYGKSPYITILNGKI